jgi:hypothetical protein
MWPEPGRYTPYQLPHSTEVAGLSTILSGDYRCLNNIFLGIGPEENKRDARYHYGLVSFNDAVWPVWINGNIYYNKAVPYKEESNSIKNNGFKPNIEVTEEGNNVFLSFSLDERGTDVKTQFVTTELLGKAKMPKEAFENPDGTPLKIDTDYLGNKRSESNPSAGPFENPGKGLLKIKVWEPDERN